MVPRGIRKACVVYRRCTSSRCGMSMCVSAECNTEQLGIRFSRGKKSLRTLSASVSAARGLWKTLWKDKRAARSCLRSTMFECSVEVSRPYMIQ